MSLPTKHLNRKSKPVRLGHVTTSPVNKSLPTKQVSTTNFTRNIGEKRIESSTLLIKNTLTLVKPVNVLIPPRHVAKPIAKFVIKEPVIQKRNYLSYSDDKLNVSDIKIKNNSFNANEIDKSISTKRPELLMVFTFNPVFSGNPKQQILSEAGKLIEIQHQASYIKRDLIGELTLNIQKSSDKKTAEKFAGLLTKFNEKLKDLDSLVGSYVGLIKNKEEIEKRFNIKTLVGSSIKQKTSTGEVEQIAIPSVKEFFAKRMGYGPTQFEDFSNTKVFVQLISDLKNIIENYSFNLLGLKDEDRKNDSSATKIDTTYTINDDFSFTIAKLRSTTEPINAINRDFFNKTLATLPADPGSRIKILVNALSKEYRISSELGDPSNKKILDDFNSSNSGTPFDNILGTPGKNIFIQPKGDKTLLGLSQFKIDSTIKQAPGIDGEEFFVLPFESKFIDFEKSDVTYVPGKYYFADSIFETDKNSFNTKPLTSYEQTFSSRYNSTKSALNTLLQLETENLLDSDTMFKNILNSCYASINGISTDGNSNFDFGDQFNLVGTDLNQAVIAGLFKLANEDTLLKNYLFQFLLLSGLATNQTSETKLVWQALIDELQVLTKFTALTSLKNAQTDLKLGPLVVSPHLDKLAEIIESRVITLITQNIKTTTKTSNTKSGNTADQFVPFSTLKSGDIASALKVQLTWTSNSSNFCKEFLNLADKFTKAAAVKNNDFGYLLSDKSGRTRFNFISTTTQLLMLFEIFSSIVNLLTKIELSKSPTKGQVAVKIYKSEQKFIFDVLSKFITSKSIVSSTPSSKANIAIAAPEGGKASKNTDNFVTVATSNKTVPTKTVTITKQGSSTAKVSGLQTKTTKLKASQIKKITTNFSNNYYYSVINDIITRLKSEDDIIIESLAVLGTIKDSLTHAKDIAASFEQFNFNDINSKFVDSQTNFDTVKNFLTYLHDPNDKSIAGSVKASKGKKDTNLEILFKLYGMSAVNMLSNINQIRNASYIIKNIKERALNLDGQNTQLTQNPATGGQDNIIVANEVKNEIKDILFSYMATADFTDSNNAETRMKIMTVGVPNNFSNVLQDRLHATSQDNIGISSLQKKQADVIKVKVYKRNLQYDELVFKPVEFIFDLSLYVSETDLLVAKPTNNELYDNIIKRVSVSDFENPHQPEQYYLNKTQTSKKIITTEQKYSFLTNEEKTKLFKNHVASFLLQNFIYLSTGMTLNEEHFLIRDELAKISNTSFDFDFEDILKSYFNNTLKKNIPAEKPLIEIEKDSNIDKNLRDIIKLYRTGNTITNPDKLMNKAFGAKFFDRVFHVPIDIDLFEIDLTATKSTSSGKKLLDKTFISKNIITVNNKAYLKKRTDRDLILEDFFINIETLA